MTSAKVLDQHSYPPECPSPGVCTTSPQRSPSFGACALFPPRGVASWRPGLPDRVFAWAADVFQAAQAERSGAIVYAPSTLAPPTGGANPKRTPELRAYQLAFSALKYQELLEDVLIDSAFGASQQMDRKFQSREPMAEDGEVPIKEVRRVEGSLFRLRTKLAASLARSRIKKNLPSIDDTLPMCVRAKHQRKHVLPICAWVNTLKIRKSLAHWLRAQCAPCW
ncbi:putative methyltransferase NSUN7 isoform X2 [Brachyhypopomus gauderio]|uniref:putative methyltransferase NSUN7 isoform X2 n=1 Tax=Brachyhypopomus gauderio TaxID=698409 RepID=UPI004041DCF2